MPGEHRRQSRVQVGDDDRQPVQRVGVAQHRVVRGVLLVDAEHRRLQRRVAGLDQVTRSGAGSAGSRSGSATTRA